MRVTAIIYKLNLFLNFNLTNHKTNTHTNRESNILYPTMAGVGVQHIQGMDAAYLQREVGGALAKGLAAVTAAQPHDPIDYLGQWLLQYVNNLQLDQEVTEALPNTHLYTTFVLLYLPHHSYLQHIHPTFNINNFHHIISYSKYSHHSSSQQNITCVNLFHIIQT